MDKSYASCSESKLAHSQPVKQDTLSVSDRLTSSEIELLRRDRKETHEYCQKLFRELKD
jgi:hypothetical protein